MGFTHYETRICWVKKGEMWGQFVAISGSLLALALFCATLVFLSVCGKLSPLAFKAEAGGNIKSKIGLWSSVINGRIFFRVAEQLQMKEHLSVRPDQTFTTFFSAMLSVSKVLERKPESTTFSSKVSALFTGCSN